MNFSHQIITDDIDKIINADLPWSQLQNKHILITGASGFLPRYLVFSFLAASEVFNLNLKVTGLVRNKDKAELKLSDVLQLSNFNLLHQDVCDKVKPNNYHIIIHAASQASPKYYGIDPVGTSKANVIGTNNLLEHSIHNNIEEFLYFSSSEVYGQVADTNNPINETNFGYLDPNTVRSCYAESKRMGETLCASYMKQHGITVKIVRPFHTYGPGMDLDDGRVYADFVKNVLENKNISINSDGKAKRAFCYIADATVGFISVLLKGMNGEAYNIGNEKEEYSIKELADKLVLLYPQKKLKVSLANQVKSNYIPSAVVRNYPDCKKSLALGWQATTTVEEGFKKTINSFL